MAWEAYCAGTIPIGAVIADPNGNVVASGRNRILDTDSPEKQIHGDMLAHAELNALLTLNMGQESRHSSSLYTTMEPCPLCMGAFYMSSIRTLHYAARDPWAGSTNLLGTTPYLSCKPIKVFSPNNPVFEDILVALHTEYEVYRRGEQILAHRFFDAFRAVMPNAVEKGVALHRSGELRAKQKEGLPASEVINWLANQVQ